MLTTDLQVRAFERDWRSRFYGKSFREWVVDLLDVNSFKHTVAEFVGNHHVLLTATLRNELKRLPRWLEHYRSMGVRRFLIFDNGSSDGTREYLASQDDVCVVEDSVPFSDSRSGMNWANQALEELRSDQWSLHVDCDEYLIYRGWPERPLEDLVASCNENVNSLFGFMLDMYPQGPISNAADDSNLIETCSEFDGRYKFRWQPQKPGSKGRPEIEVVGGPRLRMWSSVDQEMRSGWIARGVRGQLGRILKVTPPFLRKTVIENFPAQPPGLNKTPLVRGGRRAAYLNSHSIDKPAYGDESVVLLHFKFTADFSEKVKIEIGRAMHFRFGAEYVMYGKYIRRVGDLNFYTPEESRHFSGFTDFEALRFFDVPHDLRKS